MNTLRIYIVLGGEEMTLNTYDFSREPRVNRMLHEISLLTKEELKHSKIILSGKSGFIFDVKETQAEVMANYIIRNKPELKKNLILEEESMDTLGNMYFSSLIILKLIEKIGDKYDQININLITEDFHMLRANHLLRQMFSKWHTNYEISTIKAKDQRINIFKRVYRHLFDAGIELVMEKDFENFRIATFQDYEDFLFSLPVYKEYYNAKRNIYEKLNRSSNVSYYAKAIEKKLESRK
jgi:hypothetical protein